MPRIEEMMRATISETNRVLSKINKSVAIPKFPFSPKQVEQIRYLNQYAGGEMEYIPPDLTIEDLSLLGKIDTSLWPLRNRYFKSRTSGQWVLSIYGCLPETLGKKRKECFAIQNKLLEDLDLKTGQIDFGNLIDHLYLKLLLVSRTGYCYPRHDQAMWVNDFETAEPHQYFVLAHSPRRGIYLYRHTEDGSDWLGSSPMIYAPRR